MKMTYLSKQMYSINHARVLPIYKLKKIIDIKCIYYYCLTEKMYIAIKLKNVLKD